MQLSSKLPFIPLPLFCMVVQTATHDISSYIGAPKTKGDFKRCSSSLTAIGTKMEMVPFGIRGSADHGIKDNFGWKIKVRVHSGFKWYEIDASNASTKTFFP